MLTVRELMALDLAAAHFKFPGARDSAVRDQLGMSPMRHSQVVNSLLDRPDAEAASPMVVRRLRRLRDQRRAARAS